MSRRLPMRVLGRGVRDESGTVAVIAALLALTLFAAGAIAVDLGNAFARARGAQAEADFAALTAAAHLPATDAASRTAAADAVAAYLAENALQDDRPGGRATFTGQDLLDGGLVTFPESHRMVVEIPPVRVKYGLAAVLGFHDTEISRDATAEVRSLAGNLIMPLYAVEGCDYGAQVLKDRPNGTSANTTPTLAYSSGSEEQNHISVGTVSPDSVEVDDAAPTLTLTGDFEGNGGNPAPLVSQVGFFRDTGGPTPTPELVTATPDSVTSNMLTVQVPASVMAEGIWYIRVQERGNWSEAAGAKTFAVGEASTATCPAASNQGNFGQLQFRDQANPNDDIAQAIIHGPAHPLAAYTGGDGICTGEPSPAVHYPADGANCVGTTGGFKPNAVTDGLITGNNGAPGRLDRNTTSTCGSSRLSTPLGNINNDVLTCFFTDEAAAAGVTLTDITQPSYSGDAVLTSEIFTSPRFFFVPTFAVEPGRGTSTEYDVTGFRPAFLTDQDPGATRGDTAKSGNGLEFQAGKVAAVRVIFFHEKALPTTLASGLPTAPFYVHGPKVTVLVD